MVSFNAATLGSKDEERLVLFSLAGLTMSNGRGQFQYNLHGPSTSMLLGSKTVVRSAK